MKTKKDLLINIIGVLALIILIIIGINEANAYSNKIDWEPTEVYEFTNKNIDWL